MGKGGVVGPILLSVFFCSPGYPPLPVRTLGDEELDRCQKSHGNANIVKIAGAFLLFCDASGCDCRQASQEVGNPPLLIHFPVHIRTSGLLTINWGDRQHRKGARASGTSRSRAAWFAHLPVYHPDTRNNVAQASPRPHLEDPAPVVGRRAPSRDLRCEGVVRGQPPARSGRDEETLMSIRTPDRFRGWDAGRRRTLVIAATMVAIGMACPKSPRLRARCPRRIIPAIRPSAARPLPHRP